MVEYKKNQKVVILPGKAKDTHFKSWDAWRKYTAYLHIHNIPHHKVQKVWIDGKVHKVTCPECERGKK
jgi:hypothetical protein